MTEIQRRTPQDIGDIYDQQASLYTNFSDTNYAWLYLEKPAYDKYISDLYKPTTRVLDIGCGTGVVARHLISRGVLPQNVTGIDISEGQLKEAQALTPEVTFIKSSATSFDFPLNSFDLVTSNIMLHHLDNHQLEKMLDRIYNVLRPGGFYFFVEVDPDHSPEGRSKENVGKWTNVRTPWNGGTFF